MKERKSKKDSSPKWHKSNQSRSSSFGERAYANREVQQQEYDLKKERTGKPTASHATRAAATENKWNPSCSSLEKHWQ